MLFVMSYRVTCSKYLLTLQLGHVNILVAAHICKDTQNRQTFTQATQMGLRVAATAVITITTTTPPPSPAAAAVAARKMTVYSFSVDLVIKEYLVLAAKAMQPVIK